MARLNTTSSPRADISVIKFANGGSPRPAPKLGNVVIATAAGAIVIVNPSIY
jgi:hypothetical protein